MAAIAIARHLGVLRRLYRCKDAPRALLLVSGVIGVREPLVLSMVSVAGEQLEQLGAGPRASDLERLTTWVQHCASQPPPAVPPETDDELDALGMGFWLDPYASSSSHWFVAIGERDGCVLCGGARPFDWYVNADVVGEYRDDLLRQLQQRASRVDALVERSAKLPRPLARLVADYAVHVGYKSVQRFFCQLLFRGRALPFAFQRRMTTWQMGVPWPCHLPADRLAPTHSSISTTVFPSFPVVALVSQNQPCPKTT